MRPFGRMFLLEMFELKTIDVAAGILLRPDGQFLLASRPPGRAYAGYWEFPGGKLETGETALAALKRELAEELGIEVTAASPWLVKTFRYPHATVRLHFFRVRAWLGMPHPHEGQCLAWQKPGELDVSPILPANGPILRGLIQPPFLAFSNVAELGEQEFLLRLEQRLADGPFRLILREPQLEYADYRTLAIRVLQLARQGGASVLLHRHIELARELKADGVHLPAADLARLTQRPRGLDWLGTSTHTIEELETAARIGVDYAVLGHVARTDSHPGADPLGWESFARMVSRGWPFPVYAIGGMQMQDLIQAQNLGAHGIAMLRTFWK